MRCRLCENDKSLWSWCEPHWNEVKAKALVAPKRAKRAKRINECLKDALGPEIQASESASWEPAITQVPKPNFRPGGGELWVIKRRVFDWERR